MKLILILVALQLSCHAEKDWWQTGQFYQIYPRSFKDTNGDGIGDLKGIIEKLPHLKSIGITAAWLSPIFKSPMVDFGYDISDFYAIQPEYGTMADYENLVKKATKLGIKIILDFVPNHTSDQHEWFKKSMNRESGFEDFYIWHPGKVDPRNATNRLAPSNWVSAFHGSAWEWNTKRQEFYLHQYAIQQPDLNYRNPKVFKEMTKILRFWLDKGVAGFRGDALPRIFEVPPAADGNYPDEPLTGITNDTKAKNYVKYIFTRDLPETIEFVYKIRVILDQYQKERGGDTRVFLAESYSKISTLMQYYGNDTHRGAHLPFNFHFLTKMNQDSKAQDIVNVIDMWMDNMPEGCTPNWVLGNHDRRRVGSRYGSARIDQMNMLVMILPGASITYNGEEIGMLDGYISWEDTKDPAACNTNPADYEKYTRDPARTPFQWDASKNGGFSTADNTWLPVASNYIDVNVKNEYRAKRSHLKIFKDLVTLRNTQTLRNGSLNYKALNDNVLAIERKLSGFETIVLVFNVDNTTEMVNLQELSENLPGKLKCRIVSMDSTRHPGDFVNGTALVVGPYEAVVLVAKNERHHNEL